MSGISTELSLLSLRQEETQITNICLRELQSYQVKALSPLPEILAWSLAEWVPTGDKSGWLQTTKTNNIKKTKKTGAQCGEKCELPITSNTISFHAYYSHISDRMWAMHLSHSQLHNDISFHRERRHCRSHKCCELQYCRLSSFPLNILKPRKDFFFFLTADDDDNETLKNPESLIVIFRFLQRTISQKEIFEEVDVGKLMTGRQI